MNFPLTSTSDLQRPSNMGVPEPAPSDTTMANTPGPATDTAERTARTPDATPDRLEAPKTTTDLLKETLTEKLEMKDSVQNPVDRENLEAILRFLTPEPDVNKPVDRPEPEREIMNSKVLNAMLSVFQEELELQMPDPLSAASTQEEAIAKQLISTANKLAICWMRVPNRTCDASPTFIRTCDQEPEELEALQQNSFEHCFPRGPEQRILTPDLGAITQNMISFTTDRFIRADPGHRPSVKFEQVYTLRLLEPCLRHEMTDLAIDFMALGEKCETNFSWRSECKKSMITISKKDGTWIMIEHRGKSGYYFAFLHRESADEGWTTNWAQDISLKI
ncbi:hypothetical protein BDP55DRAFT_422909 [Colletotrichum godetiae]|uniref:Uncharacterized protein n=1 Tax=Colletotrichum godetiae TaxID=1209918 RepID=A0AAJ0A7W4_9PEZI|nr:uncharacterized protein BDP55DRAFT_422909 [Colletotrichum godetiae]KAK1657674.1 hypothetical protein BDP55DRAFT_422909 [Colletotrichum godetiae]